MKLAVPVIGQLFFLNYAIIDTGNKSFWMDTRCDCYSIYYLFFYEEKDKRKLDQDFYTNGLLQ